MDAARPGRGRWSVVLGCFLGLSVSVAPAFLISFGVFIGPIEDEFGWTRGEISVGLSVAGLMLVILTPLAGHLLDKWGADFLIVAGYICFPLALAAFGTLVGSYPAFLIIAGLIGVAGCVCSPLTFLGLLPRLFDRQLGLSISLAVCGLGVGQAVVPLLAHSLVDGLGWRNAWLAMAVLVAVVGLSSYILFIRHRGGGAVTEPMLAINDGPDFSEIVRSARFWRLGLGFLLISTAITGTGAHLIPLLTDLGHSRQVAVGIVAGFGVASIAGRLIAGLMLDRLPPAVPMTLFFGGLLVGLILLGTGAGGIAPYVATALIGASLGAETDLLPFLLRRQFGMKAFGKSYGLGFTMVQLGPVVGPLLMGFVFDRNGNYGAALALFSMLCIASIALLLSTVSRNAGSAAGAHAIRHAYKSDG